MHNCRPRTRQVLGLQHKRKLQEDPGRGDGKDNLAVVPETDSSISTFRERKTSQPPQQSPSVLAHSFSNRRAHLITTGKTTLPELEVDWGPPEIYPSGGSLPPLWA
jgi:hypothetical protein